MKRIIKSGCIILFVLTLILLQSRSVRAVAGVAGTVPHAAALEKEEVVYALLSAEGAAQSAYVVNVFTLLTPGAIVDYGDYKSVQNLTSEDEIFLEGDTIQISTQEKKLYYQGALTEPVALPWLINISYTLDGVPIAPGALAGKSGKLEIRLKIEANPAADQSFFDGCALQTSITLDAARCNNIAAEGATVANAGRNKQIAHTALPGKGLDATISADVENFEMDRISINGVGLAMDFDIDTDEFTGSLTELADAIGELNSGATDIRDATKKLDDGALELLDGAKALGEGALEFDIGMGRLQAGLMEFCGGLKELVDGSREFHYGLTELAAGGRTLMEGSAAIKQGLDTLDQMLSGSGGMGDISQLADSSKAIKSGISGIAGGIGMVADELGAADMTSLAQSNADMIVLIGDISAYTPAEAQVLQPVVDLLSQNVGALNHAAAAYGVLTVGDLAAASAALDAQYGQFDSGIQSLAASLSGMAPLQAGIHDLAANYADFHKGLIKYAGGVDELRKGYGELHSGLAAVYVGAIELLGGIVQTKDGSYEIADGVNEFKDGVASFEEGLRRLYEGTTEYSDGTNTFYEETADMDSEIQTRLDDMLASLTGGDVPLVSFASKKNTDIRAVQFVMATEVIKLQEKELVPVDDAEDEDTFITRLKNLFQ